MTHISKDWVTVVFGLMTGREFNSRAMLKGVMRRFRLHKGLSFSFGSLLTGFLRSQNITAKEADYKPPHRTRGSM